MPGPTGMRSALRRLAGAGLPIAGSLFVLIKHAFFFHRPPQNFAGSGWGGNKGLELEGNRLKMSRWDFRSCSRGKKNKKGKEKEEKMKEKGKKKKNSSGKEEEGKRKALHGLCLGSFGAAPEPVGSARPRARLPLPAAHFARTLRGFASPRSPRAQPACLGRCGKRALGREGGGHGRSWE